MRLEPLCELRMQYENDAVWLTPYGGDERMGYGHGPGKVTGERLQGRIRWSNHPRRREDGVWCPDLNGAIETEDGARLVVALRGYSIDETVRQRRAIVAAAWFWADDERYRWLNYVLGVGEGEIDEDKDEWWLRVFACRNEVAAAESAITYSRPAQNR